MNAKKEAQTIQGTKQEFLKIFREMCYNVLQPEYMAGVGGPHQHDSVYSGKFHRSGQGGGSIFGSGAGVPAMRRTSRRSR